MLIESTEQFQASEAIAIRRGPNELTESDYAELTPATRTKLRILQEHGVVRLLAPEAVDALAGPGREHLSRATEAGRRRPTGPSATRLLGRQRQA